MDSEHFVRPSLQSIQDTSSLHCAFLGPLWKASLVNLNYNAGGKLDSCNYVTARCAHLMQQCAASHHSGAGYRDHTLSYMQLPLKKKVYGNPTT